MGDQRCKAWAKIGIYEHECGLELGHSGDHTSGKESWPRINPTSPTVTGKPAREWGVPNSEATHPQDEREVFLRQADIDWRYESEAVKKQFGTRLMALAESAWDAALASRIRGK